jgi:hypothetical protein
MNMQLAKCRENSREYETLRREISCSELLICFNLRTSRLKSFTKRISILELINKVV